MKNTLSPRAKVWILTLLLVPGSVLVLLWVLLPKHVPSAPPSDEEIERSEPVAAAHAEAAAETTPQAGTASSPPPAAVAKLATPDPSPVSPAPGATADASIAKYKISKRMRGALNFVSGVVNSSPGATTTK